MTAVATMAARHWQPEETAINGKKVDTSNSQLYNLLMRSSKGESATRVQTPWFPAWAITYFPPQSASQPGQTNMQLTASDVTSYREFMAKYEACERRAMSEMGPVFYNQLTVKQQKAIESYSDMLRSKVGRLQEDSAPFMRASMSRTCRAYYARSVDVGTDPQHVSQLRTVCDRCTEPEQKRMNNGGIFYVYQRKDPADYASAIMALDTFSYQKSQSGDPFCQVQPRIEQLLLAPATEAYQRSAGSYVDYVTEEQGFQFFDVDDE